MKIIVACEESQTVCKAFRERGHEAYSADIQEPSGGHPEWHILGDVLPLINGDCTFFTMDGRAHNISGEWDLIIAHPPCTYLTVTGNRWYNIDRYGDKAIQRHKDRKEAINFFMLFANAGCEKIAIENPVGIMSSAWRKPDQIIQPWQFGDAFEKRTCLWLKGLPRLQPTNIVDIPPRKVFDSGKSMPAWYAGAWTLPKEERAKLRSKPFRALPRLWQNNGGCLHD